MDLDEKNWLIMWLMFISEYNLISTQMIMVKQFGVFLAIEFDI